jgi:hypothetical protein
MGSMLVTMVRSILPSAVPGQLAVVLVKVATGVGFTFALTGIDVH